MKDLIKDIVSKTLENGGTTTSILTGEMNPETGFMCSLKDCTIINIAQFNTSSIEEIIRNNKELLSQENIYLGTWVNEGMVYIDISENINNIEEARAVGITRKQLTIFDCSRKEVIGL